MARVGAHTHTHTHTDLGEGGILRQLHLSFQVLRRGRATQTDLGEGGILLEGEQLGAGGQARRHGQRRVAREGPDLQHLRRDTDSDTVPGRDSVSALPAAMLACRREGCLLRCCKEHLAGLDRQTPDDSDQRARDEAPGRAACARRREFPVQDMVWLSLWPGRQSVAG